MIVLVLPGVRPTGEAMEALEGFPGDSFLLTIVSPLLCPVDDDEGMERYWTILSEVAEVIGAVPHMHCGSLLFQAALVCREFDAVAIIVDVSSGSISSSDLANAVAPTKVIIP